MIATVFRLIYFYIILFFSIKKFNLYENIKI